MMESRLQQNSSDLEDKIKEMNFKHEEELHALQNAIKRQEEDMTKELTEKNLEIEKLRGRFEADLTYEKSLVSKRENQISELEDEILKLRAEVQHFQAELQQAATTTGEIQQKAAKVQDINVKHEEELRTLQNALKKQEEDKTKDLTEKNLEIEQLKGRLEESRRSREDTLEEMHLLKKKKYDEIDKLRLGFEKKEVMLKEKDRIIEEKCRKNTNLIAVSYFS
jgi:chromosome segregation ATPase